MNQDLASKLRPLNPTSKQLLDMLSNILKDERLLPKSLLFIPDYLGRLITPQIFEAKVNETFLKRRMFWKMRNGPPPNEIKALTSSTISYLSQWDWERDEALGDKATSPIILYINQNHPKLKSMLPTWSDRIEQITKIWNELSNETQKFYIDKARVNLEIRMSTQVIKE